MKKNKRSRSRSNKKRRLIIIILSLFLPFIHSPLLMAGAPQQSTYTIKGVISDHKGIPLPGVTIRMEGSKLGVASDAQGRFTLNLPQSQGTLIYSFIGFKTQKVPFTAGTFVNVRMEEQLTVLDEVQIVAYGEQSKRETIGSVATVKADKLKDNALSDIVTKLQGLLSGVDVINTSGAPGNQGSITVRGFNSLSIETSRVGSDPLWVVDGVPLFTSPQLHMGINPLSTIPSGDIERIDVLKDASSCSMYGSRAANGVILITIKSGRFNEKSEITASVTQSYSFKSCLPALTTGNAERKFRIEALRNQDDAIYDYLTNSQHYIETPEESERTGLNKDYFWNKGMGQTLRYLQDSLNPFFNNSTSMYQRLFRIAKVTDANLNITGGSQSIAYSLNLSYYTEEGALVTTGFKRASLSGSVAFKPIPKLSGRVGFSFTRTGSERTNKNFDPYIGSTDLSGIPKIPSVAYTTTLYTGEAYDELLRRFKETREDYDSYRFRTNFYLNYGIFKGLSLKTSFAFDYLAMHRNTFMPTAVDDFQQTYSGGSEERNLSGLNEDILTYDRWIDDQHHIKILTGISFQLDQYNSVSGYGRSDNNLIYFVPQVGRPIDPVTQRQLKEYNSDKSKSALVSYFTRIAYNYRDKYLFEATFRRDGSSRFGKNTRWGTFPSLAAGYTFTEENFMKGINRILSYGKLRFSWGKTGRQFEKPYLAQGAYGPGLITFQGQSTMMTSTLPNPDLTWEETDQYDLGLDLNLFNYRLGITADYYYRYTDKLLYQKTIPGNYTGFRTQMDNLCAIVNQGIELTVNADIIRTDKFKWNISVNIARNWNRLDKSQNNHPIYPPFSFSNISIVGKELNRIFVLDDRGFYKNQEEVPVYYNYGTTQYLGSTGNQYYRAGDRKIIDVNRDGLISALPGEQSDRVDGGSPLPVASGGINMSVEWKGFDLNISMPYSLGRHILYANSSVGTDPMSSVAILADLNDYTFWQEGAGHHNMPPNRAINGLNNFHTDLMSNVYRVNYLKVRLLSLGYTFKKEKLKIGELRLFVSGENLFTIKSDYPGVDPEMADPVTGRDNLNTYPLSRKINFGLTVKF